MKPTKMLAAAIGLLAGLAMGAQAMAAETKIAVAANFTDAAKDIAAAFKTKTGHDAILSFGSSGQFYTQITQDAPFEVFLSADAERPKKLVDEEECESVVAPRVSAVDETEVEAWVDIALRRLAVEKRHELPGIGAFGCHHVSVPLETKV